MIAGIFDEFFGVPTHPLAVHAPVVLIPILAVASAIALAKGPWRERATVPLAGLSFAMVAMLFVAKQSGEALLDSETVFLLGTQDAIDRHQDLGTQTVMLGVVWFVIATLAAVVQRVERRRATASLSAAGTASTGTATLVLNVLAVVAVVVTTIWLIRTGHAGAESRWAT